VDECVRYHRFGLFRDSRGDRSIGGFGVRRDKPVIVAVGTPKMGRKQSLAHHGRGQANKTRENGFHLFGYQCSNTLLAEDWWRVIEPRSSLGQPIIDGGVLFLRTDVGRLVGH
jgi:hypothetical protein